METYDSLRIGVKVLLLVGRKLLNLPREPLAQLKDAVMAVAARNFRLYERPLPNVTAWMSST